MPLAIEKNFIISGFCFGNFKKIDSPSNSGGEFTMHDENVEKLW